MLTAWLMAAALVADAAPQRSVLIMPIQARGVAPHVSEVVTALLVEQVHLRTGLRVITYAELEGMMAREQLKQMLGCDTVSCAAEIANALNSDETIFGSVTLVGATYVVTLSRVMARDAVVARRASARAPDKQDDVLLQQIPRIVDNLYELTAEKSSAVDVAPVKRPAWHTPARVVGTVALVGGPVFGALAALGLVGSVAVFLAPLVLVIPGLPGRTVDEKALAFQVGSAVLGGVGLLGALLSVVSLVLGAAATGAVLATVE